MEKRLKRIEIILVGVIILLIANSIISLASIPLDENENLTENSTEIKPLPSDVTREFTDKKAYKIKTDYNNEDWSNLYDVLGDYAKASIQAQLVETEFDKLNKATGKIERYSYSHYEYINSDEGADWFKVYYKCRFSNGRGIIELHIRNVDERSEISGININLEAIE